MYDYTTGHPLPLCGNDIFYMQIWHEDTGDQEFSFAFDKDIDKKKFYKLSKELNTALLEQFSFMTLRLVKAKYDQKIISISTNIKDFSSSIQADYFSDVVKEQVIRIWEEMK